jgi:undecaprenyl-diphosphatase
VIFEFFEDAATLALAVALLHYALGAYVRRWQPAWSAPLAKRRVSVLLALVLAVTAIKVSEDVVRGESGPIDTAILVFIHGHVPVALTGFFEAVTLTGSSRVLLPLTFAATVALLLARRRAEALLLAASVILGATVVYVMKAAVGRARPALWESDWYWGSSFPSGHTLVVAAFATAAVICVRRILPAAHRFALAIALPWIFLVGFSRIVIAVHWPTDVLVAACIGAFLPLAMGIALELRRA